ncbi:MAG: rhomboid family intramembrane serine protease [Polyangiaceae bacterium]|nr:rhomboid family intramembrane serine protease [Polyangiaceae bacterium]
MIQRAPTSSTKLALVKEVKAQATVVGSMVGVLWLQEIVDAVFFRGGLDAYGIRPRTLDGLLGIFFAPFLHGGFAHLIANTIPLMVLSFLIMLRRKRDLLVVTAISALVGGLGIWLVGAANSVHIGASILVFGYLGYMLSRGIFERSFWSIVGSVAVFLVYGGALFGVLPGQAGISWEGHLFGFFGGVLSARLLTGGDRRIAVRPIGAAGSPPRALR